jgi:TPR repeat protein
MEQGLKHKCPFCREPLPTPDTPEKGIQNYTKRAKANDPVALCQLGQKCDDEGDFEGAVGYYTRAADLGDMMAHYNLSFMYAEGKGVKRDLKKNTYHLEEAAIGGHASARYNLGCEEGRKGKHGRAVKHFIIAAKLGHDGALEYVKMNFQRGYVNKEDYEAALRGHQAAVDAAKSQQREEAEKAIQEGLFH